MQPTEEDNPPENKENKRRPDRPTPPRLQILIPHPIPQITYSKPPDDTSQEHTSNQLALTPNSVVSNSDNSLSPPRSPNRATSSPTSPLPLTRDFLYKKDKLDRTLDRGDHRNRKQEEKQGGRLDIREWQKSASYQRHSRSSSVNSIFEPSSAGGSLTIPSPKDPGQLSLKTPTSPQLANFMHESAYQYYSGIHDSSVRNSSHSGSSGNANRWSSLMSTRSAHSGSSVADDNLSAEAFDPTTNYYTQREEYNRQLSAERRFQSRADLQRPLHARFRREQSTDSSHYVWNILCNIASRVVTAKSCETQAALFFLAQSKSFAASSDLQLLTGDDAYLAAQHAKKQKDDKPATTNEKSSNHTADRHFSISKPSRSSQDNNSNASILRSSASISSIPKSPRINDYPNYNVFKEPETQSKLSGKAGAIEIEDIAEPPKPSPLEGNSLFIFSAQNRFRLILWHLLRSQWVFCVTGIMCYCETFRASTDPSVPTLDMAKPLCFF